jgi:integrase
MVKQLTDAFLKAVAQPKKGRRDITDAKCTGLVFRITANGARSWSFRFRDPQSGQQTRVGLGSYPAVSLAQARAAVERGTGKGADRVEPLRAVVAAGGNPVELRRRGRIEAPKATFGYLAERYMTEHAERHKRSAPADRRNLDLHILPKWRSRRYDSLRRADLVELVEVIVTAGKPTLANRIHALISKIGSFAVDAGLLDANPFLRTAKRGAETIGQRVLADDEISLFWRSIILPPVSRRVGLALRLALLTGTRAGEVAGITRHEIEHLDAADRAAWTLPPERSKNGRAHYVPLSPLAVETIRSAFELIGGDEASLFPSPAKDDGPIRAHALAVAMARFADKLEGTGATVKGWKAKPPTPHDLRRTVRTRLAELGIPKEDCDAVMNHSRGDVGSKHYDKYERAKEKRAALNLWADALGKILERAAVVHLTARWAK